MRSSIIGFGVAALLGAASVSQAQFEQLPPVPMQGFDAPAVEEPTPDSLAKTPTLAAPDAAAVRDQAIGFLRSRNAPADKIAAAERIWRADDLAVPANERLDRVVAVMAQGDERIAQLVTLCSAPRTGVVLPDAAWMEEASLGEFAQRALGLYYGRWLARERFFDDALARLEGLKPEEAVDPASLLFYQAVCWHRLLDKDPGLKALDRLLTDVIAVPPRYYSVATLMKYDLANLKDGSLDKISRQVDDIEQRLQLGKAGQKTRKVQDDVIASLDKIIKQLEDQQGGGGGGGGGGGQQGGGGQAGGIQSGGPASESSAAGGQGEGNVDDKDVAKKGGWGALDDREREQALQDVAKNYPSYYRDVVEQYFRKLANKERTPAPK